MARVRPLVWSHSDQRPLPVSEIDLTQPGFTGGRLQAGPASLRLLLPSRPYPDALEVSLGLLGREEGSGVCAMSDWTVLVPVVPGAVAQEVSSCPGLVPELCCVLMAAGDRASAEHLPVEDMAERLESLGQSDGKAELGRWMHDLVSPCLGSGEPLKEASLRSWVWSSLMHGFRPDYIEARFLRSWFKKYAKVFHVSSLPCGPPVGASRDAPLADR